jgi:hypothetical protein
MFAPIIAVYFSACELEPNPAGNEVNIQILSQNSFSPRWPYELYLSVGEYPILNPGYSGFCKLRDVQFPYDLKIVHEFYISLFVFKNLTSTKLVILQPSEFSDHGRFRTLKFTVNFPPIEYQKIGLVKFISSDIFDRTDYWIPGQKIVFTENDYKCTNEIIIPSEKTSISGKLIFLEGKGYRDSYSDLFYFNTFDYYGEKDVELLSQENQNNFTFTQNEINHDPTESSVEISASYPPFANDKRLKIYLDFVGYHHNSKMLIADLIEPQTAYTLKVPLISDLECNINAVSSFGDPFYWGVLSNPFESIYLEPGTSININHKMTEQISPVNGKTGITGNDNLTVREEGEKGIYVYYISTTSSEPTAKCRIVTDKNSLRIGEINYKEFKFLPSKTYKWHVLKLNTFNSIDEFLSKPYIFEKNYHSVSCSETWYFETAP